MNSRSIAFSILPAWQLRAGRAKKGVPRYFRETSTVSLIVTSESTLPLKPVMPKSSRLILKVLLSLTLARRFDDLGGESDFLLDAVQG